MAGRCFCVSGCDVQRRLIGPVGPRKPRRNPMFPSQGAQLKVNYFKELPASWHQNSHILANLLPIHKGDGYLGQYDLRKASAFLTLWLQGTTTAPASNIKHTVRCSLRRRVLRQPIRDDQISGCIGRHYKRTKRGRPQYAIETASCCTPITSEQSLQMPTFTFFLRLLVASNSMWSRYKRRKAVKSTCDN